MPRARSAIPAEQTAPARLRTVRETLGVSQRAFAKELGVAPSSLAQWETERAPIPGPILRLLSLYEEQLRIAAPAEAARPVPLLQRSRTARTTSTVFAAALWALLWKSKERPGASSFERGVRNAAIESYLRTLGELRGLGMKLGQLLANIDALDTSLFHGETARLSASALQAKPMPQATVVDVFLRELGRTPRELFAQWTNVPLFAASIGQVHEAKLTSGERVAVKVQYPSVVDALKADLRNVKLLDRLFCVMSPAQRPGVFYDELCERFVDECDYVLERSNMMHFARFFAARDDIRIPKVYERFSTRSILTVEFVSGQSLEQFARRADQHARDRAGQTIWEFFNEPAQLEGLFHADPHSGNLVFHDGAVTFLDFGRVGRMSAAFLDMWRRFVRAVLEKDRERALSLLAQLELARANDGKGGDDLYRVVLTNLRPWLCAEPFSFTADFVRSVWRLYAIDSVRNSMNVPRDAVLWNQLIFGVSALLVPLRCKVNCREPMLGWLYGPDEARPAPYTHAELRALGLQV